MFAVVAATFKLRAVLEGKLRIFKANLQLSDAHIFSLTFKERAKTELQLNWI